MIKIIKSREQFDSLLTDEKTLVLYGAKKCQPCKEQFKILSEMDLSGTPVYCTDIEVSGMADFIGRACISLPVLVLFKDRYVRRTISGLQKPGSILNLLGT
jgi:hypothetical protein